MRMSVFVSVFVVGAGLRADTAAALAPVLRIEPDQPGVRFGSDVASIVTRAVPDTTIQCSDR